MLIRIFLILLFPLFAFAQGRWIPISEKQVLQLNGKALQSGLFDEGAQLFQENQIPSLKPNSLFHSTYNKLYRPQDFLLKLDGLYQLDSLIFYDGSGRDSVLIYAGVPGEWTLIKGIYTNSYNAWRQIPLKQQSEFLLLRFLGPQAEIGELYFYGEKEAEARKIPLPIRKLRSSQSFADFMGINAFVDDPLNKVEAVAGRLREYHNWDWHYPENIQPGGIIAEGIRFAPTPAGNWNFDNYYAELKAAGVKVYPCLQGSPKWMAANFDHKPQHPNLPADDPMAYRLHSAFIWNYAARYGARNRVPTMLNLAEGQERISGLNLIAGLETWNEPDKWWRGREGYFHPFEYAAMLSADFDGHAGALGRRFGAKQADPNLEFIMGGLAGLDTNYIEAIRLWSLYQRPKGDFPADALNFHHYSNDAGGQDDRAKKGVSPEEDRLMQRLEALVRYRNQHLPDLKIYLSEFGYDSNPRSIQAAPGEDSLQVLEQQANYLVRSLLLAQASGIDGAFIYMLRDVNAPNPTKYMSSGITGEKWTQHRPKPAYFKLKQLKSILGDYHFEEREKAYLKRLIILRFRHPEKGFRAYVLWNPNNGQSEYQSIYFLDEEGEAQIYALQGQERDIQAQKLIAGEKLIVTGSPVILIYKD
ncbi:MAG: hypothetical protein NXI09_15190 [Bacteroidetes bacterium]|nr:hypothetical protein [Bacteroidota bacterium]